MRRSFDRELIEKLEKDFEEELSEVKGVNSPATAGEGIVMTKEDERIKDKSKHTKYRSGVGMILFWSNIQNQRLAMQSGNFQKQTYDQTQHTTRNY